MIEIVNKQEHESTGSVDKIGQNRQGHGKRDERKWRKRKEESSDEDERDKDLKKGKPK